MYLHYALFTTHPQLGHFAFTILFNHLSLVLRNFTEYLKYLS